MQKMYPTKVPFCSLLQPGWLIPLSYSFAYEYVDRPRPLHRKQMIMISVHWSRLFKEKSNARQQYAPEASTHKCWTSIWYKPLLITDFYDLVARKTSVKVTTAVQCCKKGPGARPSEPKTLRDPNVCIGPILFSELANKSGLHNVRRTDERTLHVQYVGNAVYICIQYV